MWKAIVHQDGMHCITKIYILTPEFQKSNITITADMGNFPTELKFNTYDNCIGYICNLKNNSNFELHDWYSKIILKDFTNNEEETHIIDMNEIVKQKPELLV